MSRKLPDYASRRVLLPSRREAIKLIASLTGGSMIIRRGAAMVPALSSDVNSSASGINESDVQYQSGQGTIQGYLAKPKASGRHPGVIVIHSFDGLSGDIKDLVRQFAVEGFVALAPDLSSRTGDLSSHQTKTTIIQLDAEQTVQDTVRAYQFIAKDADLDVGRIAVVGLGWGSWRAMMLAERVSDLYRAVIYYGSVPTDGIERIQSPVLAQFAQNDFRDTGNAVWAQATMTKTGRKFSYDVYNDADAEFMSKKDTPANAEAARLSWKRTLEFLRAA